MRRLTLRRNVALVGLGLVLALPAGAEPAGTELDRELDRVEKRPAADEGTDKPAEPTIPIVGYRHEVEKVTPAWVIALGLGAVVFVVAGAGSLLVMRSAGEEPEPEPEVKAPPGETVG